MHRLWLIEENGPEAPAGATVIRVRREADREGTVRGLERQLADVGDLAAVEEIVCAGGSALVGEVVDALDAQGVDAGAPVWRYAGPEAPDALCASLGLPMRRSERLALEGGGERVIPLVRVDAAACPGPRHGFSVGFGAAAPLMAEVEQGGISLVGFLRGARAALQPAEDIPAPGGLMLDGAPIAEDARLLVVSSLGLPGAVARWLGRDEGGEGAVRAWLSEVRLGELSTLLGGAPLESVRLGMLTVERAGRFALDGLWLDGEGLPVEVRPGPSLRFRVRG
ncbi:MAG: hypothetical protein EA398_06755 [Deltaproteobacteria bacterium]|nr:MAG: hypothetical protein EA398_06755 [Deltaproteobacteria bacterium]